MNPLSYSPKASSPLSAITQHLERKAIFRKIKDRLMRSLLFLCMLLAVIPLFLVLGYVVWKGMTGIQLSFFTNLPVPIGQTGGGVANAIVGTFLIVFLASTLGVIWGIVIGLYLSEYGRTGWFAHAVRFSADLLASIPSIVIGIFVYTLMVKPMGRFSAYAGGVALGIIMIPTIVRNTEELMRLVPDHLREAGLALGLPRWKVILRVVLKGVQGGIMTGIILAIARVAGETAPLLFTTMGNQGWHSGLDQPISSLPIKLYEYAISPFEEWHKQAWSTAFVLVSLVFSLNLISRGIFRSPKMSRE